MNESPLEDAVKGGARPSSRRKAIIWACLAGLGLLLVVYVSFTEPARRPRRPVQLRTEPLETFKHPPSRTTSPVQADERKLMMVHRMRGRIHELQREGWVTRFEPEHARIYIDGNFWRMMDYQTKENVAAGLAMVVEAEGQGVYINILDSKSGKKLAKWGTFGFKNYE